MGISQSAVFQILKQANLKPHKTDYRYGKSKDTVFEAMGTKIAGFYLDTPKNALVIHIDEKTQIQALGKTQPGLPIRSGTSNKQLSTINVTKLSS